jgi:hypothetical protein
MKTRHQNAPSRGTNRATRIRIRKPNSLTRHPVNIRRTYRFTPVAAQIRPPHIVDHDEDDVRALRSGVFAAGKFTLTTAGRYHRRCSAAGRQIKKFAPIQIFHIFILFFILL